MANHILKLNSPDSFEFPFPPYPIQKDFMTSLYNAIEEGKLGLFESPTGTGKSLSLICGALKWLKDHEEREQEELVRGLNNLKVQDIVDSKDWLTSQVKEIETETSRREIQLQLDLINKKKDKIEKIRKNYREKKPDMAQKKFEMKKKDTHENDEVSTNEEDEKPDDLDMLLEEVGKLEGDEESDNEEEKEEAYQGVKIIFCSRTHSQLSQFVNEVKRTVYKDTVSLVPLASRQNYCVNATVQKLVSMSLMNERCLDMQRADKGKVTKKARDGGTEKTLKRAKVVTSGCPALKGGLIALSEEALAVVQDVEELATLGRTKKACPYYASRAAVVDSQVVVVPYNTLLHKSTREACGLKLDGNVIIIDEAHNLLDTISNIHSVQVTGQQLTHCYSQLTQYKERYQKRFSAINLMYLKQLIFVIGNLIKVIGGKPGCGPTESSSKVVDSKLHTLSSFILTAEIDNYNLYKLLEFCKQSKLMHKLHGFSELYIPCVKRTEKSTPQSGIRAFLKEISNKNQAKQEEPVLEEKKEEIHGQPLVHVVALLEALTSHNSDGRVVCTRQSAIGKATIKYLLLNPAPMFADIVKKARCVILAGGTMQPIEEFTDQLLLRCEGGSPERLVHFSCGHVIPPHHILPVILSQGPTGKQLDFSYQSRTSLTLLNELGRLLTNVCNIIPAGVVCFFPSYDYEKLVFDHLEKNGVIEKISAKKKVFREPKKSSQVDSVLSEYAKVIKQGKKDLQVKFKGALLFSVVGGKLSEGLNFSDDLGRCVIVVGMPYPNIKSPELVEKMSYLDNFVGGGTGRIHYENLCMKAVNQSIGRAVRHKGDYASMLLLDHRYARENVQKQLPAWILRSLQLHEKFGPLLASLVKFYKQHENKTS